MQKKVNNIIARPPVVVIMGHVDHGKSTLLDYIRKTNVVEKEAGGITQHISAYEVELKDEHNKNKKITFLDTPGHAAFSKMRERGANTADIAVLIVSAEDGVKMQTIEAWKTIEESKIPTIVAINKIDKPEANPEKVKTELAEKGIYLENYGGTIPFVEISAKTGKNIEELLNLINLVSDMENFTGDTSKKAEGFIIEAHLDPKRGVCASMVIKDGTLKKGMWVASQDSTCPVRILEDFKGKTINEASFSSPVSLIGFDKVPQVGQLFFSFEKKEEALKFKTQNTNTTNKNTDDNINNANKKIIPIIIKADTSGSVEAIEKEILKIETENALFKIIQKGEGNIGENDIKNGTEETIIIGFNVKTENNAKLFAERLNITIENFDIIYKMTEWLEIEMEKRRPRIETTEITGRAKILKSFSQTKEKQVLGGKVIEGNIVLGTIRVMRRENEIAKGKLINLEKGKAKTSSVPEGSEFGMMIESKIDIVAGDIIETFSIVQK